MVDAIDGSANVWHGAHSDLTLCATIGRYFDGAGADQGSPPNVTRNGLGFKVCNQGFAVQKDECKTCASMGQGLGFGGFGFWVLGLVLRV